jgi:DNA repair exonuclease SbcCD ATPase subunit
MNDLTISYLKLKNFKCYRGEHELRLEPKAYALVARATDDADRSNACGKSSLAEAVDYALNGRLVDEFKSRKRGWISRGEKSGEVEVGLSDGSVIKRGMTTATSERLYYFPPGSPEKGAVQEEAQKRITELLGLTREDFIASRYFQQDAMSRLITLDPGPRLDLVVGWLRLEGAQACEEDAAAALREAARQRDAVSAEAESARRRMGEILESASAADALALEEQARVWAHSVGAEREAVTRAQEAAARDAGRAELRVAAGAYEKAVERGKQIANALNSELQAPPGTKADVARVDEILGQWRVEAETLKAETDEKLRVATVLGNDANVKRLLVRGGFSGQCPVVSRECPSAAFVREVGAEMEGVAAEATARADSAQVEWTKAGEREGRRGEKRRRIEFLRDQLARIREEALRLAPAHKRWQEAGKGEGGDARGELAAANESFRKSQESASRAEWVLRSYREAEAREAAARVEAERLEREVRTAAAAVAIFGKGGAQRRLAEVALGEIEEGANALLAQAGLPFQVAVRWSREGSGMAATCGACGEAFPRSEKVKTCHRCGTDRGPQIVHKLEIEPSAQSGGARDIVGIFVQLAAADWLATDRQSRWATAMIDEPTAKLDAANRRALASHLPSVLRSVGCEQSIIIAHHASVLDALPGRIEVVSEGGWSKVRVLQ